MKRKPRMLLAILLVMATALSSTACGEKDDGPIDPDRTGALLTTVYPGLYEPSDPIGEKAYRQDFQPWDYEQSQKLGQAFCQSATPILREAGENPVCSPLGNYLICAMLAQMSDGETRDELLQAISCSGIEQVERESKQYYIQNFYCGNPGALQFIDSVWLSKELSFQEQGVRDLIGKQYATVWRDELTPKTSKRLVDRCFRDNANYHYERQKEKASFTLEPPLTLTQTLAFYGEWAENFSDFTTGTFTRRDGTQRETEYMHLQYSAQKFWQGEGYRASCLRLVSDDELILILPDDADALDELLADGARLWKAIYEERQESANGAFGIVDITIPKFTLRTQQSTIPAMEEMGVRSVFSPGADLSVLTDAGDAWVKKIEQNIVVRVDHQGVNAKGYEERHWGAGYDTNRPRDFFGLILDRPFLVAVSGKGGLPVFVGVVNEPD